MATKIWTWGESSMTSRSGSLATFSQAGTAASSTAIPAGSVITAASLVVALTTNPTSGSYAYIGSTTDGEGVKMTVTGSTGERTVDVLNMLSGFNSHFKKVNNKWVNDTSLGSATLKMNWKCSASTTQTSVVWSSIKLTLTYTAGTAPTPPTSFTISDASVSPSGTSTLSWSGAAAGGGGNTITGYLIRYKEFKGSDGSEVTDGWTDLATITSTSTSGSKSVTASATRGNYRQYVIYTKSAYATSSASTPRPALTATLAAPGTPTSSAAYVLSGSSATISWTASTNAKGYQLAYSSDSGSTWTDWGTTTSTSKSMTVSSANTIRVRVRAYNNITDYSAWATSGTIITRYTNGACTISLSPNGWTTATAATLTVTRTDGTNNAKSNYTVQRSTDNATWSNLATNQSGGTYAISTSSTKYYYRVVAPFAHNTVTTSSVNVQQYTNGTASISGSSSATATASQNFTLSWTATAGTNNAISSQKIQRSTDNSTWTDVYTGLATTARSYTVSGPTTSSTTYYYRVVVTFAHNTVTTGTYQRIYYVALAAPTATISKTSTTTVSDSLTLTWTKPANQTNNTLQSFTIQYYDTAWTNLATGVSASTLTYTVTGPASGKTRYWRVIAVGQRNSANSASVSCIHYTNGTWTSPGITIDDAKLTVGSSTTLRWNAATGGINNALSNYSVRYKDGSGSWTAYGSNTTNTTMTVAAPAAGVTRSYTVLANFARATSGTTQSASVTAYAAPGAPTSVLAPAKCYANTSYTVSWSGATGADHYESQFCRTTNGTWGSWSASTNRTGTSFTDAWASLPVGQKGKYRIRTINGAGTASAWKESGEIVKEDTAPTAPGKPSVSPVSFASGNIALTWTASTDVDGNLTGYSVEYATRVNNSASWSNWGVLASTTTNSYTHAWSQRTVGYQIKYRVRAKDGADVYSSYSAESAEVTVVNTAPSAPGKPSVNPVKYFDGSIALTWTASTDINNNLSGYEISCATRTDSSASWDNWSVLATTASTSYSHAWNEQTIGKQIKYRIRAYDALNAYSSYSTDSDVATVTSGVPTTPGKPIPNVTVYTSGNIDLTWTPSEDPNHDLVGYTVEYSIKLYGQDSWSDWNLAGTSETANYSWDWSDGVGLSEVKFHVYARDAEHNTSGYSEESDTVLHEIVDPILWPKNGNVTHKHNPIIRFMARFEAPSRVYISRDRTAWTMCTNLIEDADHIYPEEVPAGIHVVFFVSPIEPGTTSNDGFYLRLGDDHEIGYHDLHYEPFNYAREIESGSVIADENISHRDELYQMLGYVNSARQYYGLPTITFSDPVGYFATWRNNVCQLQNGVSEATSVLMSAMGADQPYDPRDPESLPQWPDSYEFNLIRTQLQIVDGDE